MPWLCLATDVHPLGVHYVGHIVMVSVHQVNSMAKKNKQVNMWSKQWILPGTMTPVVSRFVLQTTTDVVQMLRSFWLFRTFIIRSAYDLDHITNGTEAYLMTWALFWHPNAVITAGGVTGLIYSSISIAPIPMYVDAIDVQFYTLLDGAMLQIIDHLMEQLCLQYSSSPLARDISCSALG